MNHGLSSLELRLFFSGQNKLKFDKTILCLIYVFYQQNQLTKPPPSLPLYPRSKPRQTRLWQWSDLDLLVYPGWYVVDCVHQPHYNDQVVTLRSVRVRAEGREADQRLVIGNQSRHNGVQHSRGDSLVMSVTIWRKSGDKLRMLLSYKSFVSPAPVYLALIILKAWFI